MEQKFKLNKWHRGHKNLFRLKYNEHFATPKIHGPIDLEPLCPPVNDQGSQGSCTGQSGQEAFDFLQLMDIRKGITNTPEIFVPGQFVPGSREGLYWCARMLMGTTDQDSGSDTWTIIQALERFGLGKETTWPYQDSNLLVSPPKEYFDEATSHKITQAFALGSIKEIDACLAAGFPAMAGFDVYSNAMGEMQSPQAILTLPTSHDTFEGGHEILIIGVNGLYYKCRNSWGVSVGDHGNFHMPKTYFTEGLADDAATIRK